MFLPLTKSQNWSCCSPVLAKMTEQKSVRISIPKMKLDSFPLFPSMRKKKQVINRLSALLSKSLFQSCFATPHQTIWWEKSLASAAFHFYTNFFVCVKTTFFGWKFVLAPNFFTSLNNELQRVDINLTGSKSNQLYMREGRTVFSSQVKQTVDISCDTNWCQEWRACVFLHEFSLEWNS